MQPNYLPWLGLFARIAQADTFVLFDQVQYQPRDYNNRNRIWTSRGPLWLTVPVLTKGYRDKPISDIHINNTLPWQRKHWRSIEQSYQNAKYWDDYAKDLSLFYTVHYDDLVTVNDAMLQWFLDVLGIKVNYRRASDYHFTGTKSALVLDMCKQLGATTYIFGALGREYADVKAFEQAGIEVRFQDYTHPTYSQFGGPFVSNLSVLDLLMHHGLKAKEILL
jgi:hypothetical protein